MQTIPRITDWFLFCQNSSMWFSKDYVILYENLETEISQIFLHVFCDSDRDNKITRSHFCEIRKMTKFARCCSCQAYFNPIDLGERRSESPSRTFPTVGSKRSTRGNSLLPSLTAAFIRDNHNEDDNMWRERCNNVCTRVRWHISVRCSTAH